MDEYNGLIPEDEVTELDPKELDAVPRDAELPADEPVSPEAVGADDE